MFLVYQCIKKRGQAQQPRQHGPHAGPEPRRGQQYEVTGQREINAGRQVSQSNGQMAWRTN
jgi:hypothetical protein